MPDSDDNLHLEIGHVLFIDIVGYSKLLIEEQKERLHQLTEVVLGTAQVRASTDEQLVRLPTGDGMALVFHHSAEEPARCALEIAEALQKHPEIPVRMGIHSGPVSAVTDVSGRANIAGAGINMAKRVMDCGDAGHILLSQHVADDLVQYAAMGLAVARSRRMRGQAWRSPPFGESLCGATGQLSDAAEIPAGCRRTSASGRKASPAQQHGFNRRARARARRHPRGRSGLLFHLPSTSDEGRGRSRKIDRCAATGQFDRRPGERIFLRRHVGRIHLLTLAFARPQGRRAHLVFSVQRQDARTARRLAKSSACIICSKGACVNRPSGCASRWRWSNRPMGPMSGRKPTTGN